MSESDNLLEFGEELRPIQPPPGHEVITHPASLDAFLAVARRLEGEKEALEGQNETLRAIIDDQGRKLAALDAMLKESQKELAESEAGTGETDADQPW